MKVLIVDDEVIIRNGLSTVINWEEHGFSLLEPAESAEDALEIVKINQPHIVLTDIQMSGKSGLDLAREVKQMFSETEVIILSGYDDFVYAQKAIREGVGEYLLKTSRPQEIINAVISAKERIIKKQKEVEENQIQKKAFRNKLLEKLLFEEEPDTKLLADVKKFYLNLNNGENTLQVAIVFASKSNEYSSFNRFFQHAVMNTLSEILSFESLEWNGALVLILQNRPSQEELHKVKEAFARTERLMNCHIFTAAGSNVEDIKDLHKSFEKAKHVFGYRWLLGNRGYVSYDNIKDRKGIRKVCSSKEESEMAGLLKSGNTDELKQWVKNLLEQIRLDPDVTPDSFNVFLQSVLISGYRWIERVVSAIGISTPIPDWKMKDEDLLTSSPEDILFQYFDRIMDKYRQMTEGKVHYVQEATIFIQDNLNKNLSLIEVASHVHINPNYFSELFKRETGMGYIEFVKTVRIEKAMAILRETPVKISEVAKQVGYEDIKYFTKLFRLHTGMTPTDFRKKAEKVG
ncbi:two-component system response regulator YesN [Peribacillus deserti]|uniref:Two-component system response regulator YesN n=1 Tax=Peribacillus deserti TaxID=673318 RepID=A0ABS2QFZ6_9BACI|nr:response regulator [Peribacillus deserti]MBM7691739.1 two-component system response regulator YesN [Peribacillus deserti]